MKRVADRMIIEQLQKQILSLQGHKQPVGEQVSNLGLGEMEAAFPGGIFPRGVIHELISTSSEEAACTSGFLSIILGKLMQQTGFCLWISTQPRCGIFPPAFKFFGVEPDRVLFVDVARPKETLWAIEEALKCNAVTAVVGELTTFSFEDSRRLQLAVERSQATGFIHRFRPKTENAVACVSRWKIKPLASATMDGMPGLGFPRWRVELLKVKSGKPGTWQVEWSPRGLDYVYIEPVSIPHTYERQIG